MSRAASLLPVFGRLYGAPYLQLAIRCSRALATIGAVLFQNCVAVSWWSLGRFWSGSMVDASEWSVQSVQMGCFDWIWLGLSSSALSICMCCNSRYSIVLGLNGTWFVCALIPCWSLCSYCCLARWLVFGWFDWHLSVSWWARCRLKDITSRLVVYYCAFKSMYQFTVHSEVWWWRCCHSNKVWI